MIKGQHKEILKIYEQTRENQEKLLKEHKDEIEKTLPEISNLERKIAKLSVELSVKILKKESSQEELLHDYKKKITELRARKYELLASNNYPIDYLEIHNKCPKCKDTGYIGTERCLCYKQKLVALYYKNSELKELLKQNNFNNFSYKHFSTNKMGIEPDSPRKNMENTVYKSMKFIENFSNTDDNMLFFGDSGTGKTYLSHCIAKELLDKGNLVVYKTADDLIQNLKQVKFENNKYLEDLLLSCDLLIIDDLGTEQMSEFAKTELFNFLNKKLLRKKKMLISTNLSLEMLLKNYSERISSRLIGNFNLCKFFGEDIRIQKNIKGN